jgi:dihydroorotate dehydrogenase
VRSGPRFRRARISTSSQTPQNFAEERALCHRGCRFNAGLFAVYYLDSRSAIHRYIITPPFDTPLDPEASHRLAVRALGSGFGPRDTQVDDERLKLEVLTADTCFKRTGLTSPGQLWGTQISNPVGLAAGFDKNGEAVDGLGGIAILLTFVPLTRLLSQACSTSDSAGWKSEALPRIPK